MTHPRTVRALLLVATAVLVGVVVYGQVAPTALEAPRSAPARQVPLTDESPVEKVAPTPTPTPVAEPTPEPQAPRADAGAPVPSPGVRTSTEVEAAAPAPAPTPADEPAQAQARPASLLPDGIPRSASQLGKLVSGFPAAVPIVDDSTIVSSSVDSNGGTVQATVVARTPRSADQVLELYQTAFAALGLPATAVASANGDRALAFARDGSSVTLTVSDSSTTTNYSLFAVIALAP